MSTASWGACLHLLAICLALCAADRIVTAQEASASWKTAPELGRWNLIGHGTVDTPRAGAGIILPLDTTDPPSTLHSPRFSVPKRLATAVEIEYFSNLVTTAPPIMRVAWLDDTLNEDRAEACMVKVPIETGTIIVTRISLASSPCWTDTGVMHELAINIDQEDGLGEGELQVYSIRLLRQ
jgi:hypothetical protein